MKRLSFKSKILVFAAAALTVFGAGAGAINSAIAADSVNMGISSRGAYLMDYKTGTPIFEYKATDRHPIASMVKIMTLNLIYEAADAGKFGFDDMVTVSQNAAGMGGSQAFLDAHKQYKIDDLITAITIASANDACVAMAEHIDGSVEGFVDSMNKRAAELGMENTKFTNCTGLPTDEKQFSCARDAGIMLRALISHPHYFKYSTIWMKDLNHDGGRVTGLTNTNKLIRFYEGCDGGKTGFTNEAMHCLAATAVRNGMRLISVVIGANDSKTRFAEVSKQFNYGFANYANKTVVEKDAPVESPIAVSAGKAKCVTARTASGFTVFGSKSEAGKGITTETVINELRAPVYKDSIVGKMKIFKDGKEIGSVDLIANEEVLKKTFGDAWGDLLHMW